MRRLLLLVLAVICVVAAYPGIANATPLTKRGEAACMHDGGVSGYEQAYDQEDNYIVTCGNGKEHTIPLEENKDVISGSRIYIIAVAIFIILLSIYGWRVFFVEPKSKA